MTFRINIYVMKKIIGLLFFAIVPAAAGAQGALSIDSCRSLALHNNKQLQISKLKQDAAGYLRKVAKAKYLPRVSATGGYMWMSKEISILNDDQKNALNNLGTNAVGSLNSTGALTSASTTATNVITQMAQQGLITVEQAQSLGQQLSGALTTLPTTAATSLNSIGSGIVDAFRTDTRNIFAASVNVVQPVFLGGRITALNKMAEYSEQLAYTGYDQKSQGVIYDVDNAYWLVVSLKHKQKLAEKYLQLVQKLDDDVQKMIKEGVATRADGLKVDVKVNEAEMQKTQADNGVSLAKMYLSQLCGLPVSDNITLADENDEVIDEAVASADFDSQKAEDQRPELQMLSTMIGMSEQVTKMARADYMPMVALTGGYLISNPNTFNGFEKKFSGVWNVGVLLRVPIWNWFETANKIRASKAATSIARLEYEEAKEKIQLQLNQSSFKVSEANKKYAMALKNTEKAEENLRCANLGFKEGVIESTTVMEAQTAWLQAQTQKIDAAIDVKITQLALRKAMGEIYY